MKFDMTGFQIGRITVIELAGRDKQKQNLWFYRCSCGSGKVKRATTGGLRAGRYISCGCLAFERMSKLNLKPPGTSSRNRLIENYQRRARRKGLPWEISTQTFFALVVKDCYYCGSAPSSDTRIINANGKPDAAWHFLYNGLDRVDSALGYTINNVVPCCRTCNLAKRELPQSEFVGWLNRLVATGGGVACRSVL